MKIFLDTANIEDIRVAAETGILDGVTTNPSLIAKEGKAFEDVIAEICALVDGPISAEVVSEDAEGMIAEARHLAGLRKNALAAAIGKSPTAVATYENGAKRPAAATVAELALALQVDPGFFLSRPGGATTAGAQPHFRSLRSTTQLARDQARLARERLAPLPAGKVRDALETVIEAAVERSK